MLRFRLFDASGAGRLSLRDLRRAVKDTELPISEAEMLGRDFKKPSNAQRRLPIHKGGLLLHLEYLLGCGS